MLLNEIFNTKVSPKWKSTNTGYVGSFTIDEKEIEINIDEYDVMIGTKTYSLIDFGFKVNGSWEITNEFKNSSKILGAVLNAFISKVKQINPDCILFGVNFINGSSENRKSLYSRIANLYSKGSSYHNITDWIKTKNGEYKIISKLKFNKDEMDEILSFAQSIEAK